MRASLDTNVIIHLYRAELQGILFDLFDEGVLSMSRFVRWNLNIMGRTSLQK